MQHIERKLNETAHCAEAASNGENSSIQARSHATSFLRRTNCWIERTYQEILDDVEKFIKSRYNSECASALIRFPSTGKRERAARGTTFPQSAGIRLNKKMTYQKFLQNQFLGYH